MEDNYFIDLENELKSNLKSAPMVTNSKYQIAYFILGEKHTIPEAYKQLSWNRDTQIRAIVDSEAKIKEKKIEIAYLDEKLGGDNWDSREDFKKDNLKRNNPEEWKDSSLKEIQREKLKHEIKCLENTIKKDKIEIDFYNQLMEKLEPYINMYDLSEEIQNAQKQEWILRLAETVIFHMISGQMVPHNVLSVIFRTPEACNAIFPIINKLGAICSIENDVERQSKIMGYMKELQLFTGTKNNFEELKDLLDSIPCVNSDSIDYRNLNQLGGSKNGFNRQCISR